MENRGRCSEARQQGKVVAEISHKKRVEQTCFTHMGTPALMTSAECRRWQGATLDGACQARLEHGSLPVGLV